VSTEGPTKVVDGYFAAPFDETYKDYKEAVERSGYQITFDEKEEHDSEINYKGQSRSGQIALRDDCRESGITRIHITSRPAYRTACERPRPARGSGSDRGAAGWWEGGRWAYDRPASS
jgi:hypothetical protein